MNELSVYKQMTQGANECLAVLKREINLKSNCTPFAIKLITSLNTLTLKTQQQELDAANTLLSGLQSLAQGGIIAEDYDKIDFVKRGNTIVPSARVEAFLRAAARKGYRITDTIVAVPQEDRDTTYFKENFYNGDIIYSLEDRRINPDREITPERLISGYFDKFICRLDVHDIAKNTRLAMTVSEISNKELLTIASASEQGLYKSRWVEYTTQQGYTKKRKEITNELNDPAAFWIKWCGEMTNKTIIRRALKRIKEVLPELTDSIYAFEQDEVIKQEPSQEPEPLYIECPQINSDVDINNLTDEQIADCKEMYDLFCANPKLAEEKLCDIRFAFDMEHKSVQEVINLEYASIAALSKSKSKWAEIRGYFENEAS